MIHTGICSVTFRQKSPEEIVALVAKAGLDGIEWGGDVHAPPNLPAPSLAKIRKATEDAGLTVSSYGSYYNVAKEEDCPQGFGAVLDAAEALGTKTIRIWCGGGDSAKADEALYQRIADRTSALAQMAAPRHITLAFEFHRGGLTDTVPSTLQLLKRINRPNVKSYYQVYDRAGATTPQDEIAAIFPSLCNVHCHHSEGGTQRLLADGRAIWTPLIRHLKTRGFAGFVLIEFTLNNDPENFARDAATLRSILEEP